MPDLIQTPVIYGIGNCDTVRKARSWLRTNGIDFRFHDYRKQGLETQQLNAWVDLVGWETLLNRRSRSFRQLSHALQDSIDRAQAIAIMQDNPTTIKRPLLLKDNMLHLGFSLPLYQRLFQ